MQLRRNQSRPTLELVNFHKHEAWVSNKPNTIKTMHRATKSLKISNDNNANNPQFSTMNTNDNARNLRLSDKLKSLISILNIGGKPSQGKNPTITDPYILSILNSKALSSHSSKRKANNTIDTQFLNRIEDNRKNYFQIPYIGDSKNKQKKEKDVLGSSKHTHNSPLSFRSQYEGSKEHARFKNGRNLKESMAILKSNYILLLQQLENKEQKMMDTIITLDNRLKDVQKNLSKYENSSK